MTDTHAHPATRDAVTAYGERMPADTATEPTPATLEVLAACDEIDRLLEVVRVARIRRDAAVVRMHTEDGMTAPQIERALGRRMSKSNVRTIAGRAGFTL
jgi:hypothetical protein